MEMNVVTTVICNDCLAIAGKSQEILIVFYAFAFQQLGLFLRNNTPYLTSRGSRNHDERLVAEQGIAALMGRAQLSNAFHFGLRAGGRYFSVRLCP